MTQNRQQSHTESRWQKHAFLHCKGFIFHWKTQGRGSTRRFDKWNKPSESKDTQKGMGTCKLIYNEWEIKGQILTQWAPQITLIQHHNNVGTIMQTHVPFVSMIRRVDTGLDGVCFRKQEEDETRWCPEEVQWPWAGPAMSRPSTWSRGPPCPF